MTKGWGCHNRAPLSPTVVVQTGWTYRRVNGRISREAVMREIPDPMTKDCQYTLSAPADPRCAGCRWHVDSPTRLQEA